MVIPPIVCVVMMAFMPESPVLLLQKGKDEEAKMALGFYRGQLFDITKDMDDIKDYLKLNKGSFRENMKRTASLNGLLTLIAVHVFNRACRFNIMGIYDDVLYKLGNVYGLGSSVLGVMCLCSEILATLTTVFLIERIGRRPLWLISSGIVTITTILIGVYFIVLAVHEEKGKMLQYFVLWVVFIYMIGYGLGTGALPWCMLSELPAPGVKNFIVTLVVAVHWIATYLTVALHKKMEFNLGEGITFLIIGGVSIAGFLFLWFCVRETKGQSLYEIQKSLKSQYKRYAL